MEANNTSKDIGRFRANIFKHSAVRKLCIFALTLVLNIMISLLPFVLMPPHTNAKTLKPRIPSQKPGIIKVPEKGVYKEIIVSKIIEDSKVRLRGNMFISLESTFPAGLNASLLSLNELFVRPEVKKVKRLFTRPESELDEEKKRGEQLSRKQLADLNLYYIIQLSSGADPEPFLYFLNSLDIVEIAYLEPIPTLAQTSDTPNYQPDQSYLDNNDTGVHALYSWALPGGAGAGVKIVDIENGWQILHEDLPAPFTGIDGENHCDSDPNSDFCNHGTAVIGVMVAKNNGIGVTGIAYDAQWSAISVITYPLPPPDGLTADAINRASGKISAGDIILIEQHAEGDVSCSLTCECNCDQFKFVPMEYWDATFDAISAATANGRVVVEAAGNGSMNLDCILYQEKFNRNHRDSGAILVGAGYSTNRNPHCWTNFGSRVDLQGWGDSVVATGYGDLLFDGSEAPNRYYTDNFRGTSSASPIVAGSAAVIQGRYKNISGGFTLSSSAMRDRLKNTGTPQGTGGDWGYKDIGPLPNIEALTNFFVSLNSNLSSGSSPLPVDFTADVSGTTTDTINYTLWWNCNEPGISVDYIMAFCGSIPTPTLGTCASNENGIKCNGITDDPKTASHTYLTPGIYTAKVIAERGAALPAESRITITVDHGDTFETATVVNVGDITEGVLEVPGDRDYFKFTVTQAGTYVIYTRGDRKTQGHLYNSSYDQIGVDTNFDGQNDNFRIVSSPPLDPGTYYVEVKAYAYGTNEQQIGPYTIHIDGPGSEGGAGDGDDCGDSAWSATPVGISSITSRVLEVPGDRDYFKFTVTQAGTYVIYTRGDRKTQGYLYNSNYDQIGVDTMYNGEGDNFRMVKLLDLGTYYVEVKAYPYGTDEQQTGPYTFHVHIDGPEDGAGPTGSILINGGADYTTKRNVTLTLSASDAGSGVSQMKFSEDGGPWGGWEPYAASKPWALTSGNGIKTVYVQFQDGAGNPSEIFFGTILLTKIVMDFDGDNKSDISVWRPGDGFWYIISSKDGSILSQQWGSGALNDVPVAGDYDGDGKTDYAVYRPGDYAYWYILKSSDGEVIAEQWGSSALNDVVVPGDYDGDGKTDIAIWRAADGYWYIISSKDGSITATQWGAGYAPYNDLPVPADYDGDGKTDIAIWRAADGYWYIINSKDESVTATQWGSSGLNDVLVPGDYDGDGKTDIAVWRPGDGYWYIISSKDGSIKSHQWGAGYAPYNDVPVPGDYDGDGKTDIAIWRPGDGYWYIINSKDESITATPWGAGYDPYNDEPISQ